MTSSSTRPMIRRRSVAGMLAAGALLAAGACLAADQANAAASAQVQGTTLVVTGNNDPDRIALRLEAGVPTTVQVDVGDDGTADASFDRATFDRILVNARGGDDSVRIDDANGTFTDTELTTISGGGDDDTLLGGGGNEILLAGSGEDTADGNRGNDVAFMGSGHDTFIWDPGDGSDVVEGQNGYDTMDFRGSGASESFDASANGQRLRFFRDVGAITMDTDGVERVDLKALGGNDTTVVNDLSRTDVTKVHVDLAGALGGSSGDALADSVVVNATPGDDEIDIRPRSGRAVLSGLAAKVVVAAPDPALDTLTVNALGGEDVIRLGGGLSGLIKTSVIA
jgi:RTX calcium-binding nonapeptide repeat (4 copies)